MNLLRQKWAQLLTVAGVASAASMPSQAALDAGVTTAMATAQADIAELGVIIIGIAAVAFGFKWLKGMIFG